MNTVCADKAPAKPNVVINSASMQSILLIKS